MTTERLNCNQCGATLDVPTSANFVTCNACGAQLTVKRSGGVSYTEASSGPVLREMADRLDELTCQNELARIDREWDIEQQTYLRTGRYGQRYRPTVGMSIFTGVVAVIGGGIWTLFTLSITSGMGGFGVVFPIFGVFFVAMGVGMAIYNYNLATRYEQGYQAYQERPAADCWASARNQRPADDDRDAHSSGMRALAPTLPQEPGLISGGKLVKMGRAGQPSLVTPVLTFRRGRHTVPIRTTAFAPPLVPATYLPPRNGVSAHDHGTRPRRPPLRSPGAVPRAARPV